MAVHYNLSKVYELSDNSPEFIKRVVTLFVKEVPLDLSTLKKGIADKDYEMVCICADKIKPTLDLMGMNVAYEENLQIMEWARRQGKRKEVKEIFKSVADQIEKAVREIQKNFDLI
jgi:ABC-type Fe3+-citrate transport system substrate-binding protein